MCLIIKNLDYLMNSKVLFINLSVGIISSYLLKSFVRILMIKNKILHIPSDFRVVLVKCAWYN